MFAHIIGGQKRQKWLPSKETVFMLMITRKHYKFQERTYLNDTFSVKKFGYHDVRQQLDLFGFVEKRGN